MLYQVVVVLIILAVIATMITDMIFKYMNERVLAYMAIFLPFVLCILLASLFF